MPIVSGIFKGKWSKTTCILHDYFLVTEIDVTVH